MHKATKVPSARQETEKGSVNGEVCAQNKLGQAGINFFPWDKVQTCQQCYCNTKQNSGSLLHCKQTNQQTQCALFHNLWYLPPPRIKSTSGIKYHFIIATELHKFTESLHLSFYAQKYFWDRCYPISDPVFTGMHA